MAFECLGGSLFKQFGNAKLLLGLHSYCLVENIIFFYERKLCQIRSNVEVYFSILPLKIVKK